MFTPGSKLFFGLAGFSAVAAVAYSFGSDVELFGIVAFVGLALSSAFLGATLVASRDATAEPGTPPLPGGAAAPQPSVWPILGALAVGILLVGVVTGGPLLVAGALISLVVVIEWAAQAWSEQVSGDPAHNQALRNRVMLPVEIPVGAAAATAVGAISISRVLLAVGENASVAIAGVVAFLVLVLGSTIAVRPRLPRGALATIAVIALALLLGGGITGALIGERDFEAHAAGGEHAATEPTTTEPAGEQPAGEASAIEVAAIQTATGLGFDPASPTTAAGDVTFTYVNDTALMHTLVIEGVDGFRLEVAAQGDEDEGTATLEPGTYTIFCDVPGHRDAGMEAELVVE